MFVGENPWKLKMMCQRWEVSDNFMRQSGQLIFPRNNQDLMQEGWNRWEHTPNGWTKSPSEKWWMQMGQRFWDSVVWYSWKAVTGGKALTATLILALSITDLILFLDSVYLLLSYISSRPSPEFIHSQYTDHPPDININRYKQAYIKSSLS